MFINILAKHAHGNLNLLCMFYQSFQSNVALWPGRVSPEHPNPICFTNNFGGTTFRDEIFYRNTGTVPIPYHTDYKRYRYR
ncbi:hypothetical protein HanPI659440_Chr17g0665461 [Helianthus annuus]|nr:hypothetical protein HanPI659440_Chr17g0665461 [Helianthus annuus]